ncbi:hypothetical protein J2Z31_005224 [Sinorhizobium kostiense]|uniref:CBS domain-containing protein n=1 Tax=Sinorhizobium kostiense TaxID=76747 RepID=A0ABS4R727_9HYPH|nr:hypothetical protein [Sinorhizobium kostiense]MBP2238683.1 hypothetical protein [Sinorhizobium kostiense]
MSHSWFDHIASSVTVRDVMQKPLLFTVGSEVDRIAHTEAREIIQDPFLREVDAALVLYNDQLTRWLLKKDFGRIKLERQEGQLICTTSFGRPISEIAQPFGADRFIAANTTVLNALYAFSESDGLNPLFVLDDAKVAGSLTYERLKQSFPFRTCLLALVLGLEEQALRMMMLDPVESMELLPERRKEKLLSIVEGDHECAIYLAEIRPDTDVEELERLHFSSREVGWYYCLSPATIEVFDGPYGSEEEARVQAQIASNDVGYMSWVERLKSARALTWSQFADKKEYIVRRAKQGDLGSRWGSKRSIKMMKSAQSLRNYCAHPGSEREPEVLHAPGRLTDFVRDATELTRCISSLIDELEGVVRKPELSVVAPRPLS